MATPSHVFTARYVAELLAIDEDLVEELAIGMEPEDGCIAVIDSADEQAPSLTTFTRNGIECLREIIDDKARENASP